MAGMTSQTTETHPVPRPETAGDQPAGEPAGAAVDELDALADADPAAAPDIADGIAAVLADRLEANGSDRGAGD